MNPDPNFAPLACFSGNDYGESALPDVMDATRLDSPFHSQLRATLDVPLRRIWTIITAVVIVLTVLTIYVFKATPIYQASARVEIDAETPQVQSVEDPYRGVPATDDAFLKTQVRVIESDNLALQTIAQLGLANGTELLPRKRTEPQAQSDPQFQEGKLLRIFKQRLGVSLVPETRIVEISFESPDPNHAARIVNAMLDNYLDYNFHEHYDATRQASGWMEQQLDELKAKVERSQKALVDYERQNALVNVNDKQNVAEERLADLNRDLTVADNDVAQKESLFNLVKSDEKQVAFVAQNELLQRLEEKSADLKSEYVDDLGKYGPNFPKVVRLRDQVAEMQSLIDGERRRTIAQIQNDYQAALGRENLLAAAVARQKAEVGRLNELSIQHNLLKREFESNQQLYDNLLQRLKDATVSAGLRATNIHVVDRALPPTIPVRPQKVRSILTGLLAALLVGITLTFVQESFDSSVKTAEDAERLTGIPALASIPAIEPDRARYALGKRRHAVSSNGDAALLVLNNPSSPSAESYRALRTAILFSTAPRPPQTLLVTSGQPSEGKTCTCLNLAFVLAQRGVRVLVVDSDLRRPCISSTLHFPSDSSGLTGVLTGACSLEAALQPLASVNNVWVLPAGPVPPNPAELLSSASMEKVLQEVRGQFDHILLDSPPALMFTDATILSSWVDGVLLVVHGGATAKRSLLRSYRTLKMAGARILGVVMNRVSSHQDTYGYYDSDYYNSYSVREKELVGHSSNGHH